MSGQSREEMLIEKYRALGQMPGGELHLRHADALHYIDDCKAHDLLILGMDFYIEKDGGITQITQAFWTEDILTRPDAVELTTSQARRLIKDGLLMKATWVSFVVEEQSTYIKRGI